MHLRADTREFQEAFDDHGNLEGRGASVAQGRYDGQWWSGIMRHLRTCSGFKAKIGSWNAKAFLNPKALDDGSTAAMYANHSCDPSMTAAFVKLADLSFDERQCALLAHLVSSRVKATLAQGTFHDDMRAVQSVIVLRAKQPIAKGAELTSSMAASSFPNTGQDTIDSAGSTGRTDLGHVP